MRGARERSGDALCATERSEFCTEIAGLERLCIRTACSAAVFDSFAVILYQI